MSIKKEQAFKALTQDFESCSGLILKQLKQLGAILESETPYSIPENVYRDIKSREKQINEYEVKISKKVINTIVLYNPVASELRQLMAMYRLAIMLERVGDNAFNMVRHIKKVEDINLYMEFIEPVKSVEVITREMVEKSLLAFSNNDLDYAIWTIKNDDLVDNFYRSFTKKLINIEASKLKTPEAISTVMILRSIVSRIERIGDMATNIAEAAIFYIEGKDIRHKNKEALELMEKREEGINP